MADPLYYKRYDRGLLLRLEDAEGEVSTIEAAKTLRSVRISPAGRFPRRPSLELRHGYRLDGVEHDSADELAREQLDRLAPGPVPFAVPLLSRDVGRPAAPVA